MPRVEFKPTTPVFEQTKKVHALDYAAIVVGDFGTYNILKIVYSNFLLRFI
jgi:hypothetical protein